MKYFKAIWAYRYFILSSVQTEFRSRFIRSRLGGIWMILHPLAQVMIYALVLSAILSAKLPGIESQYGYAIYLMAGISCWTLFSDVLSRGVGVFVDNGNLLKKIAFPKVILPIIVSGSALVNNIFLLCAVLAVFSILGQMQLIVLLWLPLLIFLTMLLSLGLGIVLGIINVFIRDIGQIVPIVLQFWFWLTPIVYMPSIIPERYQVFLTLNPISAIVKGYQDVLVYGKHPDLGSFVYPIILSFSMLLIAVFLYFKANEEMVDLL